MLNEQSPTSSASANGVESLTSQAYLRLKQDIISGRLLPGRKLKIEELRRHYDIGTSPIREALSLLTSDHLVERLDQRGFRVSDVSEEEFSELLKTRCWLEERALRESIANGSDEWEERVVLANHHLSRIPRSQATDHFIANAKWEAAHKYFHMTLIAECGSSLLLKFCQQLYDQNIRYRQLSGTKAYPKRDIADEHSEICNAVLDRDADRASMLLMEHYKNTGIFVKSELGA